MTTAPFRRRTLVLIVIVGACSILAGLGVMLFGDDAPVHGTTAPDSFSRSAIGHLAFRRLLEELSIPVVASRRPDAYTHHVDPANSPVVLFLEPELRHFDHTEPNPLRDALARGFGVVLVLPKWEGLSNPHRPGHISDGRLRPASEVVAIADRLGIDARVHRVDSHAGLSWSSALGVGEPGLHQAQLLNFESNSGHAVTPLLSTDAGVLVAHVLLNRRTPMLLVSDPDLFSNSGLGEGDNAQIAVASVSYLRHSEQPVFIDETLHGHQTGEGGIWSSLFRFPLGFLAIQGALLLVALLLLALPRFVPIENAPPAIGRGKRFLIANTAGLLRFGGKSGVQLQQYFDDSVNLVARRLHAPSPLSGAALWSWLQQHGAARGVPHDPHSLAKRVAALATATQRETRQILRAALAVDRWRRAMLDAPVARTSPPSESS